MGTSVSPWVEVDGVRQGMKEALQHTAATVRRCRFRV